MKINIKATGVGLTPALSDYVDKKISSVDKYLTKKDEGAMAHVEIGKTTEHHKNGEVFRAEVHITGGGYDLYASSEEEDLYASIDKVKDEITRELVSTKEKNLTMSKKGGRVIKDMMKGFSEGAGRLKRFRFKGLKKRDDVGE